ncbi:hypothetical protein MASR1M101_26070 [Gemmatimonas sp.]
MQGSESIRQSSIMERRRVGERERCMSKLPRAIVRPGAQVTSRQCSTLKDLRYTINVRLAERRCGYQSMQQCQCSRHIRGDSRHAHAKGVSILIGWSNADLQR